MDQELRKRGIAFAFFGMLGVSTDSFFIRLADVDGFDVTFWVGVFTSIVLFATAKFVHGTRVLDVLRTCGWPMWVGAALQHR